MQTSNTVSLLFFVTGNAQAYSNSTWWASAPLAVSSAAHTDSHKKICKQMLKELSQASSCCSFLEHLDAFLDKKDKLEESMCIMEVFSIIVV